MSSIKLRNSTILNTHNKPYIVAELNTSHFGNIEIAKEMISQAKLVGCDCVKFQSWSKDTLYSKSYYDENPIAERFIEKFSFSESELVKAADFSKSIGIDFSSTPYSRNEVNFLIEECKVPYIKVASMDLNNYPFLEYIAMTNVPIVLSTGMAQIEEIEKAIQVIENTGNKNVCILHCISIYPPETSTIHLKNILGLQKKFPVYPIGLSDHSVGIEIASAAVALGACLIEKHFTLDQTKIGMDNQMAIEPLEMKQMIRNCHNVHIALGHEERIVLPEEMKQRKKIRRSIISARSLTTGKKLEAEDFDVKRPGTGLPPDKISDLIGKTLIRDVEANILITESDILEYKQND